MKKGIKIVLTTVFVIVVLVCAWFVGYYTRKSQDNLPSLEAISKMDEADVNELLIGYRNYQLDDIWEEPDDTEIYFNRPDGGYELVLVKEEATGEWIRPTKDMEAQD